VHIGGNKTVISQYPKPTRSDVGLTCNTILGDTPFGGGTVHSQDVIWADGVVDQLNNEVAASAATNGWRLAPGLATDFNTHGYCASNHWINTYSESGHNQGNEDGTLPPNAAGTGDYSVRISQTLTGSGLLQ